MSDCHKKKNGSTRGPWAVLPAFPTLVANLIIRHILHDFHLEIKCLQLLSLTTVFSIRCNSNLIKISPLSRSSFVFVARAFYERQKQTGSEIKGLIFKLD